MRIAAPVTGGKVSAHFGHCEAFALVDVDLEQRAIVKQNLVEPPAHQPGLLPGWLAEQGVDVVLAGGMGSRAQDLFAGQNVEVCVGVPSHEPSAVVAAYLRGELKPGDNACEH